MKLKLFLFLLLIGFGAKTFAQTGFPYADEIRAFKHQDSLNFPKRNGILFIGSSSFRMWSDLEQRFPGEPIIKRGVGGCELSNIVNYYTPYILFPYHPRKIFIYAGENDIAYGHLADSVLVNFKKLYRMIRAKLPDTKIYYLSIKPSPSREKYREADLRSNEQLKNYIKNKRNCMYIDVDEAIYKPGTTQPDSSLFRSDYLHLNSKGYDRWQKVLEPYVK
ncbi:MAG TPA: GDSL-type esterase/lipase family protein [Mucilaginibacter sp.]|nr:GDSL-type esterase/lipase family protein [Mucilaginibacter sp.]